MSNIETYQLLITYQLEYTRMPAPAHAHTHTQRYIHIHIHTQTYAHTNRRAHTQRCAHTHIHKTRTHTYTNIHTYMYTYSGGAKGGWGEKIGRHLYMGSNFELNINSYKYNKIRGESPSCRLINTASMLEWLRSVPSPTTHRGAVRKDGAEKPRGWSLSEYFTSSGGL